MDSTAANPRRRWFRFGLRTMFVVVTVFSLWLGWQAKVVRDRRETIAKLRTAFTVVLDDGQPSAVVLTADQIPQPPTIPFWRKWLGDEQYAHLFVPEGYSNADLVNLSRLFPEAGISRYEEGKWPIFNPADMDAATLAKQRIRLLVWPATILAVLFFSAVVWVVRNSMVERKTHSS